MRANRSIPSAPVVPVLVYPDVQEAVGWLERAFGFRERLKIGEGHRSQLEVGEGGAVIVADTYGERRAPGAGDGETHQVLVRVDDARAHCEQARAAGARILKEPADYAYGERQYTAEDPAGHRWTFSETLADVAPGEWGGELVDPA